MGIRGLTTYITNHSEIFLENYELCDIHLVIDGCSLVAQLYRNCTKANDSFGGDYDKFHKVLVDFFLNLQKCNVTPIIILDGGFEYKKLKTLYMRMNNRVSTITNLNPGNQGHYQVNPLLQMEVFKETLRELEIKLIICDFEADFQIASVARFIQCPVLSLDSDYFIYDCLYIPINTLNLQVYKNENKFHMKCKLYRVERFLNRFGGLDKSLLPLMATLLGNDYVQKSTFQVFFSQLKLPHSRARINDQQRTIAALLNWLRPQTFETAKRKILARIKMNLRPQIDKIISESVAGYNCSSEYILEHFGLVNSNKSNQNMDSYILMDTSDYKKRSYSVPQWFIEKFRCGIYPASFINIITKQTYLFTPQMEDMSLINSHDIALRIVKILFGLLTSPKRYHQLSYISRAANSNNQARLQRTDPIYVIDGICDFPPLTDLPVMGKEIRDGIFFHALCMQVSDLEALNNFPDDWKLIIISITYWIRTINDLQVTTSHLFALILSMIHLKCLDSVIGFHRSEKVFLSKFKQKIELYNQTSVEISTTNLNLTELINVVTERDAILAVNILIPNFNMSEKLYTNPKIYSIRAVHCFAEFQAAFRQITYLNCLLEYPFLPASSSTFYNGTFIYQMFMNLKKRNDPYVYINTILKQANSVFLVFDKIVQLFQSLTPSVFQYNN